MFSASGVEAPPLHVAAAMTIDAPQLEDNDDKGTMEFDPRSEEGRRMIGRALDRVRDQARAHPGAALGIGAGIGYVLGGGVPKFWVMLAMAATGGLFGYALPALRARAGAAEPDLGDDTDLQTPTPPRSERKRTSKKTSPQPGA